ncbi:hypothetical protein DPEC_G00210180 [Dallia pectoralis]|uniref:Uncharacterized protein n=1 Tax=Dallia pectoralis TaxID=75939 RepID=A0ACC2G5S3_DALPE|nr:hypothetical protein DPEC_G00210180 [Dallia pectoralis]
MYDYMCCCCQEAAFLRCKQLQRFDLASNDSASVTSQCRAAYLIDMHRGKGGVRDRAGPDCMPTTQQLLTILMTAAKPPPIAPGRLPDMVSPGPHSGFPRCTPL